MVKVRELVTELNVKGNANRRFKTFGLSITDLKSGLDLMAGAVRIAGRAVASFTTELAAQGDMIAKTATNLGIGIQAVQELDFAANIAGVGINEVRTAIQRMQKGLNDARIKGTGPFADGLKQLGLRLEDFDGLEPDEIFTKVSESLSQLEDSTTKAALAQDFFGRGGKTLIPLINEGAEGINALRDEFQGLSGGFTDDGAKSAEEFNDAMLRLNTVVDGIKISIGEQLFPVVKDIIDSVREWFLANREVIESRLQEFLNETINAARRAAPAILALVDAAAELIPLVLNLVGDTSELINNFDLLQQQIQTDFGPQLEFLAGVFEGMAAPIRTVIDLVQKLGEALDVTAGDVLGFGAAGAIAGLFEGDGEAEPRAQRGAPLTIGEARRRLAGQDPTPAAPRRDIVRASTLSPREIQARLKDPSTPGRDRAILEKQLPIAREVERAVLQGNQAQADALISGSVARINRAAEQKAAAAARRRRERAAVRGGRGGGGDEAVSDEELLRIIEQAAREGRGLDDVLGGRDIGGSTPPVIAVTVTNFNFDQDVAVDIDVSGVPGQSAEEVATLVDDRVREGLQDEFRIAVENLEPLQRR